jgi:NAD(P)-dependent dehydrogenase (short-subunit alcohol dehydrogenase family)
MPTDTNATLIVGASRGLGLGLARQLLARGRSVIGTVRHLDRRTGLHDLADASDGRLTVEAVDVTAPYQIDALRQKLGSRRLDILMINSGVGTPTVDDFAEAFHRVMETNVLGALGALRAFADLVVPDGAVAVMTSALGSIGANTSGGWEPYRSSKAALNQSLRSFAAEHAQEPWSVTAVHPGWVRTDMGGPDAPLDVETSTRGIADLLESRLGQRGCAFIDYKGDTVPW